MASTISLLIAARSAAAAALAQARAQVAALGRSVAGASRSMTQYNRTTQQMNGLWRDSNGRLRDANGRFVSLSSTMRTTTTVLGRLTDLMDNFAPSLGGAASSMGLLVGKAAALLAVGLPLVGVIGNLIPLLELIAPAAVTGGAALLVFKLALNGISDALSAGLSGDTEEFEKQLRKLSPSAANAVRELVRLRDEWKPLQKLVQEKLFHGVSGELRGLSGAIKPVADKWLPLIAESFARTRGALAEGLADFARSGNLDKVMANVTTAIDSLLGAIKPVARAFGDVLVVAAPAFAKITGYIRDAATAFGDWIRTNKDNGNLQKWLEKAMETFGKLKDIGVEIGRIIGAIFKSSGNEGDDMLDQIRESLKGIADWANGGTGQKVLDWISKLFELLGQVAPVFEAWAGWFEGMIAAVQYAWDAISAIFRGAVGLWLGYLEVLVKGAAKAFGWIPGIGPKLQQAAKDFDDFKNKANSALDGIQDEVVNITYKSMVIGDRRVSGAQLSGTYSSGIGGRATGGAAAGLVRVGERGTELVDFSRNMVYSNNDPRNMGRGMANGGGGGGGAINVHLTLTATPGSPIGPAVAALTNEALRSGHLALKVGDQRVMIA